MVFTRIEVKVREERGRAGGRQAEGQRAMRSHVEQDVWTPSSHKLFKTKQNETNKTKQNIYLGEPDEWRIQWVKMKFSTILLLFKAIRPSVCDTPT